MSKENVENVHKVFECLNRGDLNAFLADFDEHVVIRPGDWPEPVYCGKDAVRSFLASYTEAVGGASVVQDVIDAGDRVVVRIRAPHTHERSRAEGDLESSQVLTIRKGKIVLVEFFWDHQEALEAAGLSESN